MTRFFCTILACLLTFVVQLTAQQNAKSVGKGTYVRGEMIFQLSDNQLFTDFEKEFNQKTETLRHEGFTLISENMRIYTLRFDPDIYDEKQVFEALKNTPSVSAVQYNHIVEERGNPNDPQFSQQWSLAKINAPSVWDKTTGGVTACGDTIVVAILEYGFYDRTTDDLQANIWLNKDEIPNNNIDDDKNGFVDDYRGVALLSGKDNHSQLSSIVTESRLRHGTAVAGVIGAAGNNAKLLSGVNWKVKMMLISGVANESNLIQAYDYLLTQHKLYKNSGGKKGAFVPVTNFSGGFSNSSPAQKPLLCALYDTLGKYGILNFVAVDNQDNDVEKIGDMPTLCAKSSIVAITASDKNDSRAGYAYGKNYVHFSAPGVDIPLLSVNNQIETDNGTSFATPLAAGAAALLWSMPETNLCQTAKTDPVAAMNLLKSSILRGVDASSDLSGKTISGGRLNLLKAYEQVRRNFGQPIGDFDILKMYPNPVDRNLNVVFQLPEAVKAEIWVVNALGQKMYQRTISDSDLLAQKVVIPTYAFTPGLYFLTVATNQFEVTKKFVIARP
ncbi:MAG: S8 family serine peptidase [Saprospiraceae bacterium]|nr:S8 family serine peptidase [Saprospiraceae bacterium]